MKHNRNPTKNSPRKFHAGNSVSFTDSDNKLIPLAAAEITARTQNGENDKSFSLTTSIRTCGALD